MTTEAQPRSHDRPEFLPDTGAQISPMTNNEPSWWRQNRNAILIELISAAMSAVLGGAVALIVEKASG